MSRKGHWLHGDRGESTRSRSNAQETNLAAILNGRKTINSGATFGENDVVTDYAEIEAKTTTKFSYTFNRADFLKLRDKCKDNKIPMMVVQFETFGESFAILGFDDLKMLIDAANK